MEENNKELNNKIVLIFDKTSSILRNFFKKYSDSILKSITSVKAENLISLISSPFNNLSYFSLSNGLFRKNLISPFSQIL